ncbi:sce7726 family protein [Weissella confusa]|uniref:sce7726 family protein n=1 Tax=Weissella confusa TaxID=1583 RepID=UPI001C6F7B62|nr:sce7726 family protein [Weissella confusa]QYU58845.1 sce7726 family protein [Weissella confusa]
MDKLNDKQIREALVQKLSKKDSTDIWQEYEMHFDEFNMIHGINDFHMVRADIVSINGHLTGYEIKSDVDSLDRLPNQIVGYSRLFDYNYLVVGEKLYDEAVKLLPNFWGVILAKQLKSGAVRLVMRRKARLNPNDTFNYYFSRIAGPDLKKYVVPLITEPGPERTEMRRWPKSAVVQKYAEKIAPSLQNKIKGIVRESMKKRVRSFN